MSTRRTPDGYAVGRARREAIVATAAARFAEAGYAATAMARIAEDVGLSERGLLHHFPTKKHLLLAVSARRFDLAAEWIAEVPEAPDGLRPLRALLALTEHFLERPGYIDLFVLIAAEAADRTGPAFEQYAREYDRFVHAFAGDFAPGIASGALRADADYVSIARRCIAMCDGLQLQWVLAGGALDLIGELAAPLEDVARSITTTPARGPLLRP